MCFEGSWIHNLGSTFLKEIFMFQFLSEEHPCLDILKEQNAFCEASFAKVESKNIEMQETRDTLGVICLTPSLYG